MLQVMSGRGGMLRRITPANVLRHRPLRKHQCLRVLPAYASHDRGFHSTAPRQGAPILPLLIAALKSSTALEISRTAARLAMSFMPILFLTTAKSRKKLEWAKRQGQEHPRESKLLHQIQAHTTLLRLLVALPTLLFGATILASLERTPITGRWRMILLSPEEEEEVAAQLAGPGWYRAVDEILQRDGPPRLVHPSDWRYQWVRETMRHLERAIPVLLREQELRPDWYESGPDDMLIPPPADYPLRPRPRASEYLRAMCERMCERHAPPPPHNINGPPYSLLLVEDPNALNAFSYGFGPDGAGGIVVYTGFLDDILRRIPSVPQSETSTSLWGSLIGSYSPRHPTPSLQQSSELAILLAHELSHLILSHHLESLSSAKVIVPGVLSIVTDIFRVMLFPITIIFGPFASDAISNMAKMGTSELEKAGEYCTSVAQEMEADQVSTRLLAHAGFDARSAVRFWEQRQSCESLEEDSTASLSTLSSLTGQLPRWMRGAGHPISEMRVNFLKRELARWETEKRAKVQDLQRDPDDSRSAVNLLTA